MGFFSSIFKKNSKVSGNQTPRVFLTNTLSGNKELFISQRPGIVTMYTCGPTVYGPAHIGNLRSYIFSDTLARTLAASEYHVRRVINITDFGNLITDGDEGEDKMTKGLRREGMAITLENMRTMAEKYARSFIDELIELNVNCNDITFPRASDYVKEQIAFITTLEQKEYAYRTSDGVYFDTSRFPNYGKLGGINVSSQQVGVRMEKNGEKRNPADFALWKSDSSLGWQSPWGLGFPGWHIECSTMSRSLLGQEIDIHTGGEDLAQIHHNNEIAQSEAASGRIFVHYWIHNAFLNMEGEKASKSLGNVVYFSDVIAKDFRPLALRYFFLQAHYRTPLSFSWNALAGAASALDRLWKISHTIADETSRKSAPSKAREQFAVAMRDDLATPQALGILWDSLKDEDYLPQEKWGLIEDADAYLGLSLVNPPSGMTLDATDLPDAVNELIKLRERARSSGDYNEADRLREEILKCGYHVDDGPNGPVLTKTTL